MISIKGMSFGYNGSILFDELNLDMHKGNIYGLLGLNGSGKTTMMKLISGLLFPVSGDITVLGETPSRRYPDFLSRIYVLPEELHVPAMSEHEFVVSHQAFYPRFDNERFERYLREFDLPRNKKLHKMSFGQKKKFLLSFGMACGSELLVLDEPTNGMDIPSKGLFRRLVAEAISDERLFIISTHQVRDVDSLIDPITILHEGQVVFDHGMSEIFDCIHMTRTSSPPKADAEGLLYTEAAVGGYWSVWKGADENGGPIDLEILFNTVISRPEIYESVFKTVGGAV